jgi:hypothetical protein
LAGAVGRDSSDDSFDDNVSTVSHAAAPPPPPPNVPSLSFFPDSVSSAPPVSAPAPAPVDAVEAVAPVHDGPSWTRPWTLGEMRNSSNDWTLACDSGLLNFLKEFGDRVMQRTKDLDKQVRFFPP